MPHHTNRPVRLYQTLVEDTERKDDPKFKKPLKKSNPNEEVFQQYMLLSTVQLRALCKKLGLKVNMKLGRGAKARFAQALTDYKLGVKR